MLAFRCTHCSGVNRVAPDRLDAGPTCGRCKNPLDTTGTPQDVSDDELARLVKASPVPVLVDFWAAWCGPCKVVAPHVAAIGQRHAGALIVVKVDTEAHQRTAQQLQVQGIPTLAVYKGGQVVARQAGALMTPQLEAFVGPHLQAPA